jgi:hypothetical protein
MPSAHWLLPLVLAAAPGPTVHVEQGRDAWHVRVRAVIDAGLPAGKLTQEQGETRLQFALVDAATGKAGPAIFGSYTRTGGVLIFTPRHPLTAGQRYRATLVLDGRKTLVADYTAPERAAVAAAFVEKVYPTTAELPANHLKFYLYFSRPMRESRTIFDHFHILDDRGKPVLDPWRRTELWSTDGRRLTLWIHPGRIKTGVNLRDDLGPVLEPDRSYTLVIDREVLDADGRPLRETFRKKFRTTKPVRLLTDITQWKVQRPVAGTRKPVVLAFPRPLDHALLQRFVQVIDSENRAVAGRFELGAEERSLLFHPTHPWKSQTYQIVVDRNLEDLAGNTPEELFDVDNEGAATPAPRLTLTFRP